MTIDGLVDGWLAARNNYRIVEGLLGVSYPGIQREGVESGKWCRNKRGSIAIVNQSRNGYLVSIPLLLFRAVN